MENTITQITHEIALQCAQRLTEYTVFTSMFAATAYALAPLVL